MPYCSVEELVNATGSEYTTSEHLAFIDRADRQINARLNAAHVSGSGDAIKEASISLATSMMLTRMRMDGQKPSSLSLGEFSMSDNIDAAIAGLQNRAWQLVEDFISYSAPGRRYHISRSDR